MTARKPPELDTDRNLDWCRGEILFLLACLKLNQDLMQLKIIQTLSVPYKSNHCFSDHHTWGNACWQPLTNTFIHSAAAPEQNSEMKDLSRENSPGTAIMDTLEQQHIKGQNKGEGWGVVSGNWVRRSTAGMHGKWKQRGCSQTFAKARTMTEQYSLNETQKTRSQHLTGQNESHEAMEDFRNISVAFQEWIYSTLPKGQE